MRHWSIISIGPHLEHGVPGPLVIAVGAARFAVIASRSDFTLESIMPWLDISGRQIHVRISGSGPQVILLHASSSHGGQWKRLIDRLAGRFTCLAPDLHGYGRSAPLPDDGSPYFEHDIRIVQKLSEQAPDPVHLVGHSLGGTIAARAASFSCRPIASVTLFEPVLFCFLEESDDPRAEEYLQLVAGMSDRVDNSRPADAACLFLEFWTGPGSFDRLNDEARAYVIATIPRVMEDWKGISASASGQLGVSDLARISPPTQILYGANTKPCARGIIDILRRHVPRAEFHEIAGVDHMAPVTNPDRVNTLIESFLLASSFRSDR